MVNAVPLWAPVSSFAVSATFSVSVISVTMSLLKTFSGVQVDTLGEHSIVTWNVTVSTTESEIPNPTVEFESVSLANRLRFRTLRLPRTDTDAA
jgi:hypothetical protein